MSSSNAAAKKRRAPASTEPPSPVSGRQTQSQPGHNTAGLTLPQVIALIDKRLVNLESFMSDTKQNPMSIPNQANITQSLENLNSGETLGTSYLEEFNSRFEILADEIANMKNIVLSLQSYTMDVNKTLMDERIRILSEITGEEIAGQTNLENQITYELSGGESNTTILA